MIVFSFDNFYEGIQQYQYTLVPNSDNKKNDNLKYLFINKMNKAENYLQLEAIRKNKQQIFYYY